MRTKTLRRSQGFTVIELMITVAILGVLASVAIPSFQSYRWKAKRSEAYTNLGALAKSERTYFALYDMFFGVALAEPLWTLKEPPSEDARPSEAVNVAFAQLGWAPEGWVFYDYDVNVNGLTEGADSCSCTGCFTATAYGDVDGEGGGGAVKYVHKGTDNNTCKSLMFSYGTPVGEDGPIYDAPAPLPPGANADDF